MNLLYGMLAVVLHEMAHCAAALAQGLKVKRVGISRKGPYVLRQAGTAAQNVTVALAAPLFNLVLAYACWRSAPSFALSNLVLGVFCLLPFESSDGRKAWQYWQGGNAPSRNSILASGKN